jgi:glucose-6-phosphate-specific signal transduction histidine kinase
MEISVLLTVLFGVVQPRLVQLMRRYLGENLNRNDLVVQAVVLVSSAALAVLALALSGDLAWNGDIVAFAGVIYTLSNVVYKKWQDYWDSLLPQKVR